MRKNWLVILFIAVFFFASAYKIVRFPTPFYDWDESIYVRSGLEMVNAKSLVPLWQGRIWLDKPPLIILVYGLITKWSTTTFPPEVSTRLFTLAIAAVVMGLMYVLYQRVLKNQILSTLVVAITAFTPIFLQRAVTVNLDIFLLLGWLGYIVFFENFWLSFIFIFIAVMSKSLLGFYPLGIIGAYYLYEFFSKKIGQKKLKEIFTKLVLQGLLLSIWYVVMLFFFKGRFWEQHIIESHFRRVTSSLEFHFGDRIYYITLAAAQMGYFFWLAIVGGLAFLIQFFRKKTKDATLLVAFYLLPWFIFLNIVKTKIFWYFYPAAAEFAFLSIAWVSLVKKKSLVIIFGVLIVAGLFYQDFVVTNVWNANYSKPESYYYLSLYARSECPEIELLMDKDSRQSFATLDKLGLSITTTKWWGSHPSMIYYFGKKINFYYHVADFTPVLNTGKCFVIDKNDLGLMSNNHLHLLKNFGDFYLYNRK